METTIEFQARSKRENSTPAMFLLDAVSNFIIPEVTEKFGTLPWIIISAKADFDDLSLGQCKLRFAMLKQYQAKVNEHEFGGDFKLYYGNAFEFPTQDKIRNLRK